jgi:hypothetical protein
MIHALYGLALLVGIIALAVYWSGDGNTAEREYRSDIWIKAFIVFCVLGLTAEIIQTVV